MRILGVNERKKEAGNGDMCRGRTLAWLQDIPAIDAWGSWHVIKEDVVVLDQDNRILRIYNLLDYDLRDSVRYAELRGILIDAAR